MSFRVLRGSRQRGLGLAQSFLRITQTVHQVTQLRVGFGKIGIFLEDFFIDGDGHGPFFLAAEKFTHDKACFHTAVCPEGAI